MHKHHILICLGAIQYHVFSCIMGQNLRRMNGLIELTRRKQSREHLQPLGPLPPPPKGGYPKIIGTHSRCGFRGCPEKQKSGHPLKLRGKWCPDFLRGGGGNPKFSGHTPAAISEVVLTTEYRDTPRNFGKNGVLIFFGWGGGGWDPFLRGVAGIP